MAHLRPGPWVPRAAKGAWAATGAAPAAKKQQLRTTKRSRGTGSHVIRTGCSKQFCFCLNALPTDPKHPAKACLPRSVPSILLATPDLKWCAGPAAGSRLPRRSSTKGTMPAPPAGPPAILRRAAWRWTAAAAGGGVQTGLETGLQDCSPSHFTVGGGAG